MKDTGQNITTRKNRPLISVCIPAYNSSRYLARAIESVLKQEYTDYELIIVDNNSLDDTEKVVTGINDDRIYYVKNKETASMAENWNKCIDYARGKYISLLHSDDTFLPGILAVESRVLESDPQIGFVYSAVNIVDENDRTIAVEKPYRSDSVISGKEQFEKHIYGNYIYCPSIMVRKECYAKAGGFRDDGIQHFVDWDMWLKIELHAYKIGYLSAVLANYRKHSKSIGAISGIDGTPEGISERYKMTADHLNSEMFRHLFSPAKARRIKEGVLLFQILKALERMFLFYLPFGKIDYFMRTLRFIAKSKISFSPFAFIGLGEALYHKIRRRYLRAS